MPLRKLLQLKKVDIKSGINMKRRIFSAIAIVLLLRFFSIPVSADEGIYRTANFDEFKAAVEEINIKPSGETYIIHLTGDIDFGNTGYNCEFHNNTEIYGNGHTINLGKQLSNGKLCVKGAVLSLGKSNSIGNENQLKITVSAERSTAMLVVGNANSGINGTLNMYDGVELTGSSTNGSSLGSAVVIENGEFNMYGGDIHGNTNAAISGRGGAVAGNGELGKVIFNMYGGSIRNNETVASAQGYGGGVFLSEAEFNMSGGSIRENIVKTTVDNVPGYGGGVAMLFGRKAVLSGGEITQNISSYFGGGIYTYDGDLVIKDGFRIMENSAKTGGGLCNNGDHAVVTAEDGAVIANNKASTKGDDIAYYGSSLTLASAKNMNTHLSTDRSNQLITGWYSDDYAHRWQADQAQEVDITAPLLKDSTFLKAAYKNIYKVIYRFSSETGEPLPDEIIALLPIDTREYQVGVTVTAIQPAQRNVSVTDGVWEFKGYAADQKKIETLTTEFVGVWLFKPDMQRYKPFYPNRPSVDHPDEITQKTDLQTDQAVTMINDSIPQTGERSTRHSHFLLTSAFILLVFTLVKIRKISPKPVKENSLS